MALSAKQELFVTKFLVHRNASRAALEAGYSPRSAPSIGQENLKKPAIQAEIKRRTQAEAMEADEVLQRLARHARGSMADFIWLPPVDADGRPTGDPSIDLNKAAELGLLDLLKEITVEERTSGEVTTKRISIKLYDAQSALTILGKNLNLFNDKVDVRLTKELERALDLLEKDLDSETYDRILGILAGAFGATANRATPEPASTDAEN